MMLDWSVNCEDQKEGVTTAACKTQEAAEANDLACEE